MYVSLFIKLVLNSVQIFVYSVSLVLLASGNTYIISFLDFVKFLF
jgi:hypothetical protein